MDPHDTAFMAVAAHIAKTLEAEGFEAEFATHDDDYTTWQVVRDGSIQPPAHLPSHLLCFQVELVSPILPATEEGRAEVRKIYELITRTYLVNVNHTCGLHVHCGHRPTEDRAWKEFGANSWDLEHVKRLNAFLYAFSRLLDSIHPPNRVTCVGSDFDTQYCDSIRKRWEDAKYFFPKLPPLDTVSAILRAKYTKELSHRSRCQDHNTAYNMTNTFVRGMKSTVEFRQHTGTLDGAAIVAWVDVVCAIAKWTREVVDPIAFAELLALGMQETSEIVSTSPICETDFTVLDFMERINVRPESIAYYQNVGLYRHNRVGDEEPESKTPIRCCSLQLNSDTDSDCSSDAEGSISSRSPSPEPRRVLTVRNAQAGDHESDSDSSDSDTE